MAHLSLDNYFSPGSSIVKNPVEVRTPAPAVGYVVTALMTATQFTLSDAKGLLATWDLIPG